MYTLSDANRHVNILNYISSLNGYLNVHYEYIHSVQLKKLPALTKGLHAEKIYFPKREKNPNFLNIDECAKVECAIKEKIITT